MRVQNNLDVLSTVRHACPKQSAIEIVGRKRLCRHTIGDRDTVKQVVICSCIFPVSNMPNSGK